jgi:hypothetical protein
LLQRQLAPIFSSIPSNSTQSQQSKPTNSVHATVSSPAPAPTKVLPSRPQNNGGTPSIKDALAGKIKKEETPQLIVHETEQAAPIEIDKSFDINELKIVWQNYALKYKEEVHLFHTLTSQPIENEGSEITITVENSVQYEQVRVLKPEIIGYLRRELKNSQIEIDVKQEKPKGDNRVFTDDQKLQQMIQKNPELGRMKMLFHLDFNI